ncbi:DUF6397 family protein [Streptomyces sp. NBC_01190]|uniref:DUF6397 family protein n=1 Tax=Streptomyces sp. NBC_01190 TaxID=2903767 RepID=UPI0038644338|nr:DUF6397 family protein [Streptomyces sp. NBC_01190]
MTMKTVRSARKAPATKTAAAATTARGTGAARESGSSGSTGASGSGGAARAPEAPPADTGPVAPALLTLTRAREELGLDHDDFDVALQTGEVPSVVCGPGQWKVPAEAVARLRSAEGHPEPLLARLRLVSSDEAAKLLGVGRERFVRLARAGYAHPLRWYVNQYQAVVWMYLAWEVAELGDTHPELLHGPLPQDLREAVAAGEDQRPRRWRARRTAQLVRDAHDAWEEAAVWAALLGPEIVADAVPDAFDRTHLRKLRGELPPGRVGRASATRIREVTVADHPEEITLGLLALADALGRARALRPAPRPSSRPGSGPPALPKPSIRPSGRSSTPRSSRPPAVPSSSSPASSASSAWSTSSLLTSTSPPQPPPQPPPGTRPPRHAAAPARRGLGRLLPRRRSAPDLAKEPFLHHRDQQPPRAVEDLTARQAAGTGRDR